jgi:hypothetical protein
MANVLNVQAQDSIVQLYCIRAVVTMVPNPV